MNTEQCQLLQGHNLTTDMMIALANLIDGKKFRHQNRSYKALQRRGLATEKGSSLYEQYCSIDKSIPEYMREIDEKVRAQMATDKVEEVVFAQVLNEFGVASSAVDTHDLDLRAVIKSWPNLPLEFWMLIADAAQRIAKHVDQQLD